MSDVVLASQINDCSECPLYNEDCPGGTMSSPGGTPIDPPCTSWNGDEEIYAGMYEREIDYSPQSLQWEKEAAAKKKEAKRKEARKRDVEKAREYVLSVSKYGNAKKRGDSIETEQWYCPECRRWFRPGSLSYSNGFEETGCSRCGCLLVYSELLNGEDGN